MSTLKVDTVRPVTTDGSLTLQGDSSGSGVTGLVIDSTGTVTTGTLGSGVVFPADNIYKTTTYQKTTTQTFLSTSGGDVSWDSSLLYTPDSSSNILRIYCEIVVGFANAAFNFTITVERSINSGARGIAGSYVIGNAYHHYQPLDTDGNMQYRVLRIPITLLDQPSTALQIEYFVKIAHSAGSVTTYINQNSIGTVGGISLFCIDEIQQ